jgi:small subunit ribosomal protein S20
MPHTKSAMKRMRQNARRNAANRAARSLVRSVLKKARLACQAEPKSPATEQALRLAFRTLDRAARKGLLKKNEADRRKARLCLLRDRTAAAPRSV